MSNQKYCSAAVIVWVWLWAWLYTSSMAANVECSISFSNGQVTRKTRAVEGEGKQYMASMVECLASIKEEVNTALSEQVAIEKSSASSNTENQKRSSDEMISDDGVFHNSLPIGVVVMHTLRGWG